MSETKNAQTVTAAHLVQVGDAMYVNPAHVAAVRSHYIGDTTIIAMSISSYYLMSDWPVGRVMAALQPQGPGARVAVLTSINEEHQSGSWNTITIFDAEGVEIDRVDVRSSDEPSDYDAAMADAGYPGVTIVNRAA